ncbi:MAG: MarR family transcriptional regulator [Bdellovibrionales bacterium]|nr:MarR family transcriptional regulator [Bdellovibrionales bacterium]
MHLWLRILMKRDASGLKSHIGFWMRLVSNNVSHSFARKLESSGVTVAEWVVLREMYGAGENISPSTVAELTSLTRGAISKLMERLLQKKLVTRTEARVDRRFQEIKLTPAAAALVPKLAALADENDEQFFSVLTASERKTLIETLQKIADRHGLKKLPTE